MFKTTSDEWSFSLCPKTFDFQNYCPFCAATQKLYKGNKDDKKAAYNYKRKSKHVGNIFVVKDPRDADAGDDEKVQGKVLCYEFPDKLEQKIKSEMTDDEYGQGMSIFDPGEDGVDFLIKVGATKPNDQGVSFHDYSESKFTNKPYPLAKTDKEIEQIMESTHDLDEYLNGMMKDEEEMLNIIKNEMLYELIESDYTKQANKVGPEKAEKSEDMDEMPDDSKAEETDTKSFNETSEDSDDLSDEELLDSLNDL